MSHEPADPMKRRLLKLAVFLLLGAIVNVAVAWGWCVFKMPGWSWAEVPPANWAPQTPPLASMLPRDGEMVDWMDQHMGGWDDWMMDGPMMDNP